MRDERRDESLPRVLIVGGGFGGIAAARSLRKQNVGVVVLDRENHHVFQPLLYQVATASLSPASISRPIRTTLRDCENCDVAMATVEGIDLANRRVVTEGGTAEYDYLVLAAGARHHYFGNDGWEAMAPGLKSLSDATEVRRRMLLAFESAEHEGDAEARRAALTFAIVGAGPTGVELAGAIKEIASKTLPREYRYIDTATAAVILFEGGPRVLPGFPEKLSDRAQRDLERLGIEVRLGSQVSDVTPEGIRTGSEFIAAQNVFWAAGVKASPIAETLGVPLDSGGRVIVGGDLSVPGHPEVFAIGDMASFTPVGAEWPLPGVAQVAIQMGSHAGRIIRGELSGTMEREQRPTFRYKDKGSMAIIGKNRAVAAVGRAEIGGFVAWVLWAVVHIAFLVSFRNRVRVLFNWGAGWLLDSHDARLIIGKNQLSVRLPQGRPGFVPRDKPQAED